MTKDKLNKLRDRMMSHDVKDDTAIVELTARELQELLDYIDDLQDELAFEWRY